MIHFHVIAARFGSIAIASARYENYEDSIADWVKLSNYVFKDIEEEFGGLAIENAMDATDHGEGMMARVGTSALCFYWSRCDEEFYSVTWN